MAESAVLDMSLDDIIRLRRMQKSHTGSSRGRGRGRGRVRGGRKSRPVQVGQAAAWQQSVRGSGSRRGARTAPATGRGARARVAGAATRGTGARVATGTKRGAGRVGRGGSINAPKVKASAQRPRLVLRQNLAGRVARARQSLLQRRQAGSVAQRGSLLGGRVGQVTRRLQQRRLQAFRTAAAKQRFPGTSVVAAAGLSPGTALLNRALRIATSRQHQRDQRFQSQAAARQLQQALSGLKQQDSERLRVEFPSGSPLSQQGSLYSDSLPPAPRLLTGARKIARAGPLQTSRQVRSGAFAAPGLRDSTALFSAADVSSPRAQATRRSAVSAVLPGAARPSSRPALGRAVTQAGSPAASGASRRRELELLGRIRELESELAAARQNQEEREEGGSDEYEDVAGDDEEHAEESSLETAPVQPRHLGNSANPRKIKDAGSGALTSIPGSSSRQVVMQ